MSPITLIERLLKYKLIILAALIGAAYLNGQPTASALQPSPGKIPNGAKYSCNGCHVAGSYAADTQLTFAPGQTSASFQAPIAADALDEGDESIDLTLSDPANAQLGARSSAALMILDAAPSKPSISIAVGDPAAAEAGSDAASFTIARSGDASAPLQVEYIVAGTATAGKDYTPLAGSITIPAGAGSTTFALTPLDDADEEGAETVIVALSAKSAYQVAAPSSATATIADDDAASQVVRFYIDDSSAAEAGPDAGRFTIARDGVAAAPLTVYYTVGGTAAPGADYAPLAGSVTIPAGQSSAVLNLTPIDDPTVEQIEIVVLALSPHASYSIGTPASATVTIADNDTTPPSPAPPGYRIYAPVVIRGG
jgi:hypothetical protein